MRISQQHRGNPTAGRIAVKQICPRWLIDAWANLSPHQFHSHNCNASHAARQACNGRSYSGEVGLNQTRAKIENGAQTLGQSW